MLKGRLKFVRGRFVDSHSLVVVDCIVDVRILN